MNQSRVGGAITGLAVAMSFILLSTVTRIFVRLVWPADDKLFLDDYIIVFATVCFVSVPFKMILYIRADYLSGRPLRLLTV